MPGAGRRAFLHERKVAEEYSKLIPKAMKLARIARSRFPNIITEKHLKIFSERIKGKSIAETSEELSIPLSTLKRYWKTMLNAVSSADSSLISKIQELRSRKLSRELVNDRIRKYKREWMRKRRELERECRTFIEDLKSGDPILMQGAIIAIAVRGYRGVNDLLIDLVNHPVYYVSNEAVWALGELRVARAVPAIISLLRTSSDVDRISTALNALGKIATPEAIEAISRYLLDSNSFVRKCAKNALRLAKGNFS
jgi:hypothetical protein